VKKSVQSTPNNSLSIILPTFRRPEGLKTALQSLERQNLADMNHEIIVVDNDPEASAKAYTSEYAKKSDLNIKYYHDPNPGVANARNTALKAASGRYLVFLDFNTLLYCCKISFSLLWTISIRFICAVQNTIKLL